MWKFGTNEETGLNQIYTIFPRLVDIIGFDPKQTVMFLVGQFRSVHHDAFYGTAFNLFVSLGFVAHQPLLVI